MIRAYIVSIVWGHNLQCEVYSLSLELANAPEGAAAATAAKGMKETPGLPPLIGVAVREIPLGAVEQMLTIMKGDGQSGQFMSLELVKPEGSA